MALFEIDPDIRRAGTLPASFYTDPSFWEAARSRIFARTWQWAGRVEEKKQVEPLDLLPGILDAPILSVKNSEGLRCLSNVCTHRANILIEQPCDDVDLIRCNYHGRRFGLDGHFLSMPQFEECVDFPTERDDLPIVPSETWAGVLFASLSPAAPFSEFIREFEDRFPGITLEGLAFTDAKVYEVNAHWALYCENYLEGFHIAFVHPALNREVSFQTYTTETFRYSSLQTARDTAGNIVASYLFVFPNLMLNFYSWGVSVNIVRPVSPTRTAVNFLTYVSDREHYGSGPGGDLDTVEKEDERVVESVQRGVRSPYYDRGRYSPTREQGTHHFHRLIAEFMNA
jgi:choline monooxygenase